MHIAMKPEKVAVITGGANGIGLAAAKRFLSCGMRVCILDNGVNDDISRYCEGEVAIWKVDVADSSALTAVANEIIDRFGPPAILMNNAGIGAGTSALGDLHDWVRTLGVNLFGMLHGIHASVPSMHATGQPGLVINTGSKQGVTQPPGDTAYNVSKSGVKALTEGLSHTLREMNSAVTAHLLIPGLTYTSVMKRYVSERPSGAWAPEQVIDRLIEGLSRDEFYIWCQDNETTREMDIKRIKWSAGDIIEGRPALSRWHPDWKKVFDKFMQE